MKHPYSRSHGHPDLSHGLQFLSLGGANGGGLLNVDRFKDFERDLPKVTRPNPYPNPNFNPNPHPTPNPDPDPDPDPNPNRYANFFKEQPYQHAMYNASQAYVC